jgi:L-iditol 2-dehydrogenase
MKAARLTGLRELVIDEIASPEIENAGDVLVRVCAVGICGSDVHNYVEGGTGSRKVVYPFIPGHEAAGEVLEVGRSVTKVKPGDRIMIEPAFFCGECDQCLAGRFNTCRKIMFLSSAAELQGCMCEKIVIPEQNCFVINDRLSFAEATLAEPLSIALHSVKTLGCMKAGSDVGILGCGPVGLCTQLAAIAEGAGAVYVSDPIKHRYELAGELGAAWSGSPEQSDVVQNIMSRSPLGLDIVFECSGSPAALDQAVDLLKPGGTLVITGIPVASRISMSIDLLRRKEITIRNVRRQNRMEAAALELLASQSHTFAKLITHRFPLAEAQDAFELAASYANGVVKAMVMLDAD